MQKKTNHREFHHIKLCLIYMLLLFGIMVILCIYFYTGSRSCPIDSQKIRLQYRDAVAAAERNDYDTLSSYSCAIIDTNAKVIFSTLTKYPIGDTVNLHSLSTAADSKQEGDYVVPLMKNGHQSGTLLLHYQFSDHFSSFDKYFTVFLVLACVCMTVLSILIFYKLKHNLSIPLHTMSQMADSILRYDYNTRIAPCNVKEVAELYQKLELIQAELLHASNREKLLKKKEDTLLASISHDLKTPIASILGCAEGIENGLVKSEDQLKEYSEIIMKKAELLTKMINSIIENSSLGMDDFIIRQKEIYLKPYFEQILADYSIDIAQKGLTLNVIKIHDVIVFIDPDLIYQVIQNIISNSLKYTNAPGEIKVNTELSQDSKTVIIEISDTGSGISHEDLPFIFDKFFRSERARTQNIAGNGLGLSIVKNIIQKHGCLVECASISGKGTTIAFTMPLA